MEDEQRQRLMETENDRMADSLAHKVSKIKNITIQMNDTVDTQNTMLDDMSTSTDNLQNSVKRTMTKLRIVVNRPQTKRLLTVVGVFVLLFFIVFLFKKRK
ncbi:hypothetical protein EDD86DRAFT_207008 [Gorgonomyces haynaldii]|nr:hypothetical protein EDD86DRAFT_207008 [Gorgonomyces haynaldii]